MELSPAPSNPVLVKFVDYFASSDFFKDDSKVLSYFANAEAGQRELDRKRRAGELIAILWAYYEDIKYLLVSGVKMIPAPQYPTEQTLAAVHFKSCTPISLCIHVPFEPLGITTSSAQSAGSSPNSASHRRATSNSPIRHSSNPPPTPSVYVNINLGASYPSGTQPESDTSVDIGPAIGLTERKVALLRRIAKRYLQTNLGQELMYGLIWEVKYYLGLLVSIPDDHVILGTNPEGRAFELLIQFGGGSSGETNIVGPRAGGLYEALQLKQRKAESFGGYSRSRKKSERESFESENLGPSTGSSTIRKAPIKLADLISGKALTEERGRTLLKTLTTLSFTRKLSIHSQHAVDQELPTYLQLQLFLPRSQTYCFTQSKYHQFILHRTDYQALHYETGRRFRVSTIQFDLSPIVRANAQLWPILARHLEQKLEQFCSEEMITRFVKQSTSSITAEQLSTYEHFELSYNGPAQDRDREVDGPKNDLSLITFTIVKEGFPCTDEFDGTSSSGLMNQSNDQMAAFSTGNKYLFSLATLKRANALGLMKLGVDRKHMYTSKLLTVLDHLHKCRYFQGESLSYLFFLLISLFINLR